MKVRDELGAIVVDEDFACLLSTCDHAVLAPSKLALLTVMQFAEGLLDRQAAEAVRARIDWKYAPCSAGRRRQGEITPGGAA